MKRNKKKRNATTYAISIITILLICWDFARVSQPVVNTNTYRFESDFDEIQPSSAVKVAIVPSDYSELENQVSRTSKPGYEQIEDMVRKAIELQGGFEGVIENGNSVMLKVNLVGGDSPSGQGENTDVNVVKALIKTIYDFQNNVEIIVAEGTARDNDIPTVSGSVWHNSGYVSLLDDPYLDGINISLLNLNQSIDDLVEVNLGAKGTAATHNFTYNVHKKEVDADVYISVPVLKIHNPGITNALKNQIGTAPGCYYGYNKANGREKDGTRTPDYLHENIDRQDWSEEEIVDLCYIADIDFVVVDAIMCLESAKSYKPERQLRMNTIIAGIDPVAVDNVCARLLDVNPDNVAHIFLAEKVGLGTNNRNFIEVVGASIASTMKKAKKTGGFVGGNRTWILSPTFEGSTIEEEYITNEKDYIAQASKDGWSESVFFYDDEVNLHGFYDGKSNIVTYAFTKFYSPLETEAELWLGRQEAMYVYLNGELVYSKKTNQDFFGKKEATVMIEEGENTLLVKTLNNISSSYTFTLDICEVESDDQYDGNRISGLIYYTDTLNTSTPVVSVSEKFTSSKIELENYPNPVTNFTRIKFRLEEPAYVKINIYDINGRIVKNLTNKYFIVGTHEIGWQTENLKPGYYICTLDAGISSSSIKILIK